MSPRTKPHVIANPAVEVAIAIALYAAAIGLVYDAYERRGRPRPLAAGILLP